VTATSTNSPPTPDGTDVGATGAVAAAPARTGQATTVTGGAATINGRSEAGDGGPEDDRTSAEATDESTATHGAGREDDRRGGGATEDGGTATRDRGATGDDGSGPHEDERTGLGATRPAAQRWAQRAPRAVLGAARPPAVQRLLRRRALLAVFEAARPPAVQRLPRRALPAVLGAVAVAFALRLAIGLTDDAPASDETAYLQSGASLVDGEGFDRDGRPELHFPPLVPFVLGTAARVTGDPHAASVAVTVLAGTAAVVPLAAVARRLAGARHGPAAAVATAWLAAVVPGLATLPSTRGTGSEAFYTLVVASALALALRVAGERGPRRAAWAAAAGLVVGLAYLTRPEGLFLGIPLAVAVAWPARGPAGAGRRAGSALALAAFVVPIAACVVPYASFLHTHTGEWQLTAKAQDASLEAWHAVARGDRLERDRILYALDDSGVRFAAGRTPLAELAREDPGGFAAIVRTNVATLATTAVGWSLVPLPVTVLGAWAAWRHRRSWRLAVTLAVGALPVATALGFFVQPRYLVVTAAVVVVAAGVGVATLPGRWRPRAGLALAGLALAGSMTSFHGPAGWGRPADFTDQRLAGEWLADHAEPGARVVTRSMVVDLYADRPTLALPDADLGATLRYARHYGATYLVADSAHIERFRPQLAFLLDEGLGADDVDGLGLVHESTAEGRTTRVFALDPPPPPSSADGPSLGFMGDGA
jgi:4-amino-4-deoxy-L-arabinose transferase-like glycosyltransferase